MPKSPIQKSLQEYISMIKRKPSSHFRIPSKSLSSSTKRLIRGCRHPRTHSFALENTSGSGTENTGHNDEAATLEDIDRFLFENFKSLYMNDRDDDEEFKCKVLNESPRFINPPPDLCGSHRLFGTSGSSSSLTEGLGRMSAATSDDVASFSSTATIGSSSAFATADTSTDRKKSKQVMGPDDFIALLTFSPSPYDDFKQSMQEMIEARLHHHGKVDWEFMDELLSCYMNLNDKKSYKYILSAFVDLVVSLRENPDKVPARSRRSTNNRRN